MEKVVASIVAAAQKGDQQAMTELYEMCYRRAYYLAKQLVKDEDQAQDILQDSFIKAFRYIDGLADPSKFQSWLNTIVANESKDYLKKNKPILFSQMVSEENEEQIIDFEDEREQFSPEAFVDYNETKRLVQKMIDELPEEQRMAIILRYLEELPVKEIAQIMECSEGTVKSRLNYGRNAIREKVLALEKKGTKLYCMPLVPFLLWMFRQNAISVSLPAAVGHAAISGAAAAVSRTGSAASASAIGTAGAAEFGKVSATAAGKAGMAAAGKGVAVAAGKAVSMKAVALISAAAIGTGAAAGGVYLYQNQDREVSALAETETTEEEETVKTEVAETSEPENQITAIEAWNETEQELWSQIGWSYFYLSESIDMKETLNKNPKEMVLSEKYAICNLAMLSFASRIEPIGPWQETVAFDRGTMDQAVSDCLGINLSDYIYEDGPQDFWCDSEAYYCPGGIYDFGAEWPYFEIDNVAMEGDSVILTGTTGTETDDYDTAETLDYVYDEETGLYRDSYPAEMILRYRGEGKYSKFQMEDAHIMKKTR